MAKRIFSLITVVTMMISLFTISASAKEYFNLEFSDDTALSDTDRFTYKADTPTQPGEVSKVEVVTTDTDVTGDDVPDGTKGTLHILHSYSGSGSVAPYVWVNWGSEFKEDNQEAIFEFDFMCPAESMTAAAMSYWGGVRHNSYIYVRNRGGALKYEINKSGSTTIQLDFVPGKWYSFMYHANAERSTLSVYMKEQSQPTTSYTLVGTQAIDNAHSHAPAFTWSSNASYQTDIYVDNIRLYTGSNLLGGKVELDETTVTEVSSITAGDLKASAEVAETVEKTGLRKIMVVYDKAGKMIDCATETQNLMVGRNDVNATITLDEAAAAAVADDGYVGLYLWDGMLPYINAIEIQ